MLRIRNARSKGVSTDSLLAFRSRSIELAIYRHMKTVFSLLAYTCTAVCCATQHTAMHLHNHNKT